MVMSGLRVSGLTTTFLLAFATAFAFPGFATEYSTLYVPALSKVYSVPVNSTGAAPGAATVIFRFFVTSLPDTSFAETPDLKFNFKPNAIFWFATPLITGFLVSFTVTVVTFFATAFLLYGFFTEYSILYVPSLLNLYFLY